jgi:hypothetical protein
MMSAQGKQKDDWNGNTQKIEKYGSHVCPSCFVAIVHLINVSGSFELRAADFTGAWL